MAKYDQLVTAIVENLGGKENITFATHCMTRLRLNVKDKGKVNQDALKQVPGVLGSQFSGDQFQVIIGQHVSEVYPEFLDKTGLKAEEPIDENLDKKPFSWKDIPKNIADAVSGSVVPILPILTAAGVFKLIAAVFGPSLLGWLSEDNMFLQFVTFVGDAGFYFFPIYIAWSAALKFKTNPAVAMFLGACLLHPTFLGFVNAGTDISLFGIPLVLVNYSSQFLPSLLAVWVLSYVYRFIDHHVPNSIKILAVPTLSLAIMIPLTFFFIGPIGYEIGNILGSVIGAIYSVLGPVAVALVGAFWYYLVVTGMHQALIGFAISQIALNGFDNVVLTGGAAGTYAIFGVALAYVIRCKKQDKALATTNAITLILGGISEPFLFSTLIRYKQAMIAYSVGGLVGGFLAGLLGVRVFFLGATNFLTVTGFAEDLTKGTLCALAALVVSLVIGLALGFGENKKGTGLRKKAENGKSNENASNNAVLSPLDGEVIDITEVKDPAFSSKAMGDGIAIIPSSNLVKAPVSGEIITLFPTGHAVGIKGDNGQEILIHIGLDTVNENGKGFKAKVQQGDHVEAGQDLIEIDLPGLKAKGYDMTTPVIVIGEGRIASKKSGKTPSGSPVMELK